MTPFVILTVALAGITGVLIFYSLKKSEEDSVENWPFYVLGVRPSDSLDTVKKAYRELVKRYHPDRLPVNASPQLRRLYEERLIKVNNAYKTILLLHEPQQRTVIIDVEQLDAVAEMIETAEKAARSGEKSSGIIEKAYKAAETLVKTLHKSAGLLCRSEHFYDLVTDLMIHDVLSVEEFEVLADARRYANSDAKNEVSLKDAVTLVRRIRGVYLKIRERHIKPGNGHLR
ncbi:MAG: J domain-containing protein [Candidatus Caldarchaeum sp.]